MNTDNIVLLAADTRRSQVYAQCLQMNGIHVAAVLILKPNKGDNTAPTVPQPKGNWMLEGMCLPDFSINLRHSCEQISEEVIEIDADHVNSEQTLIHLRDLSPGLVIYSGFGGQLVGDDALDIAPFLHVHSGWLPEFRGSTTIYYSLLKENRCGASAILLDSGIDCGNILAKMHFEAPPYGTDLDHFYDGSIRAHLMVHVVKEIIEHGKPLAQEKQDEAVGETYYVIHPVLKHLAIARAE